MKSHSDILEMKQHLEDECKRLIRKGYRGSGYLKRCDAQAEILAWVLEVD